MTTGQTIPARSGGNFPRFGSDDADVLASRRLEPASDSDGSGRDAVGRDAVGGGGAGGDGVGRGTVEVGGDASRVSLAAVRGEGSFDGGWWPRSLRLADELPGLVEALTNVGETITRVSVNGDTWSEVPARVAHPMTGRPSLRVGWYRTLDANTITLRGGVRPPIRLLVVLPGVAAGPAMDVLGLATTGQLTGSSDKILSDAGARLPDDRSTG